MFADAIRVPRAQMTHLEKFALFSVALPLDALFNCTFVFNNPIKLGFTTDMKAYKKSPESFKGNVAQVSEAIRVAITGQRNTPDLCTICQIIGKDNVKERIENTINSL